MPGSADISGLNVQFGALDFGSEAASGVVDMAQKESIREQALAPAPLPVPTAAPQPQPQSSLFSKPGSMRWAYLGFQGWILTMAVFMFFGGLTSQPSYCFSNNIYIYKVRYQDDCDLLKEFAIILQKFSFS